MNNSCAKSMLRVEKQYDPFHYYPTSTTSIACWCTMLCQVEGAHSPKECQRGIPNIVDPPNPVCQGQAVSFGQFRETSLQKCRTKMTTTVYCVLWRSMKSWSRVVQAKASDLRGWMHPAGSQGTLTTGPATLSGLTQAHEFNTFLPLTVETFQSCKMFQDVSRLSKWLPKYGRTNDCGDS